MRILGRTIVVVLAVIGGFVLLSIALSLWVALGQRPQPLPASMVVSLDLNRGVVEAEPDSPLARLTGHNPYVMSDLVQSIDRAAHDTRVNALVAHLDGVRLGMAEAQEIRDAVIAFRKSGKRAVLFSQDLGGFGGATVDVYLASAFQEIWMQPSGDVGLTGFAAESPFIKGTLDLLGVKPQFGARWEYKSAIDMFTQSQFTKENRESVELLLQSFTKQVTEGIATARGLKPEDVRALMDRSPLLGEEARSAGLIDRLAYWDELEKSLTAGGAKIVDLDDYGDHLQPEPSAVKVALIVGAGPVQQGAGDDGPLGGNLVMSSDRITQAFRDAVKDPQVKAILFRIDSPGGSYTAADAIWREVGNARAAGKPVVVSMGDVAASGGYFAAIPADRIVAQPGTITGSIGVFAGKFVMADLWKKLGVTWDEAHEGANAAMWSDEQAFSPEGWSRLNAILDHVYADFTTKTAQGRNIPVADMDALARGRVWPGDRAKQLHLVDESGGYPEAFVLLRQLARLPSQMPLRLVAYPRPERPFEVLKKLMRDGRLPADVSAALTIETRLAAVLEPVASLLAGGDERLRMPPLEVR